MNREKHVNNQGGLAETTFRRMTILQSNLNSLQKPYKTPWTLKNNDTKAVRLKGTVCSGIWGTKKEVFKPYQSRSVSNADLTTIMNSVRLTSWRVALTVNQTAYNNRVTWFSLLCKWPGIFFKTAMVWLRFQCLKIPRKMHAFLAKRKPKVQQRHCMYLGLRVDGFQWFSTRFQVVFLSFFWM